MNPNLMGALAVWAYVWLATSFLFAWRMGREGDEAYGVAVVLCLFALWPLIVIGSPAWLLYMHGEHRLHRERKLRAVRAKFGIDNADDTYPEAP